MTDTVSVSDWERLVNRLREWAGDATVTVDAERAAVEWRNARFVVHRDGRVEAGMPLHDADLRADELAFDADAVHASGKEVDYTFRRP